MNREAAVSALVREVFETASKHLGREQAARLFLSFTRGVAGAPRGSRQVDVDALLLDTVDEWAEKRSAVEVASIPRLIAEFLKGEGDWDEATFVETGGAWLAAYEYAKGVQTEAIMRRVRNLVKNRNQKRSAAADQVIEAQRANRRHKAYLRKAGIHLPPTLLGTEEN